MFKRILLASAFALAGSVAFAAPPEGRGPPEGKGPPGGFQDKADKDRRVACNKGWGAYVVQNQVDNKGGQARRQYLADCLARRIEPPAPLADDAD